MKINFKSLKQKITEQKKQKQLIKQVDANSLFNKETKKSFFKNSNNNLKKLFNDLRNQKTPIDEYFFDLIEEQLLTYDIGYSMTTKIISEIKNQINKEKVAHKTLIIDLITKKILDLYEENLDQNNNLNFDFSHPNIMVIVGVNGVGKTTTIAKLANRYLLQNKKILLIAADTFRAGAVEQLQNWATKLKIEIVVPTKINQDPASVIFKGIEKGYADKFDLIICDTSGRLENKANLMNELTKINKIIKKFDVKAPHETLLILDATTGQSGLTQAKIFNEAIPLTGIILTKLDSSSKGGIILAIKELFNLPVKLIGTGENLDDLSDFEITQYLTSFIDVFDETNERN